MRYFALACDYDGTLAFDGRVAAETLEALEKLRDSGRRLILVTGRDLPDLSRVFPPLTLFDRIVAENGAVMLRPATGELVVLAEPPPPEFAKALESRGVNPIATGHVIVATASPHENTVLSVIRDLELELQVIFNRGSVMILPSGCNKGTGLSIALGELGLSPRNTVGVGDAENDHAFLRMCECSVGVGNAIGAIRERVDWVTEGEHGYGIVELAEALLKDDLADLEPRLSRHYIPFGNREDGTALSLAPHRDAVLLAGTTGGGKTSLTKGIIEGILDQGYQVCLLDPEGDYEGFANFATIGSPGRPPTIDEVLALLADPSNRVRVGLLGLPLAERPRFFAALLARIEEHRAHTGRPHWLVLDEAHHMLPAAPEEPVTTESPMDLGNTLLVTLDPDQVARSALERTKKLIVVGAKKPEMIRSFARVLGRPAPRGFPSASWDGWLWEPPADPVGFWPLQARAPHLRHRRKYADGDLGPDRSFYFRGPEGRLKLRAQNVTLFAQLAEGVDDETWKHHLMRGDYSAWIRDQIKDEQLAQEIAAIEKLRGREADNSRALVLAAIANRYTAP